MSTLRILTGADWGLLAAILLAAAGLLGVMTSGWARSAVAPSCGISPVRFAFRILLIRLNENRLRLEKIRDWCSR